MHTIRVSGDIDFRRVTATRQLLLKHLTDSDGLVVDMSDVKRVDSAGLAGLVEVVQAARISGRSFQLRSVTDSVRSMIEFARLDKVFFMQRPDHRSPAKDVDAQSGTGSNRPQL